MSKGNAYSVMCSYNAVNGVPSCANSLFQNTAMRDEWGFEGYIVKHSKLHFFILKTMLMCLV